MSRTELEAETDLIRVRTMTKELGLGGSYR